MRKKVRNLLAAALVLTLISIGVVMTMNEQKAVANTPGFTPPIVINNANWAATDAIGRALPTFEMTGPTREDKYVGLFYWLWHHNVSTRNPARNATETIYANPSAPNWGAEHHNYHFLEPEMGYYRSDDPWVIRRHLIMFANAGVDFLYLDYTNDEYYVNELEVLFQQSAALRAQGVQTPYIVFFFNHNPEWKVRKAYEEIYSQNHYSDLWFYWDGKPLIMSPKGSIHESEILNFFTWRQTWAFDPNANDWLFLDHFPQHESQLTLNGTSEQIIVNKGMGSPLYSGNETAYKGSSGMAGQEAERNEYWESPHTGTDRYMAEQTSRALQADPAVVLFTGWNELTAGTWPAAQWMLDAGYTFMGVPLGLNGTYMVDQFNREFNRDIEPVRGYDTDNSYYEMVSFIRYFKGMAPPPSASSSKTITIGGGFGDWDDVTPEYKDTPGDTMHRNHLSLVNGNNHSYVNTTGRNDITAAKMTYDNNNVYFYVRTAAALSAHTDANWMHLYIDADNSKETGWEGYDYLINRAVNSSTETTLSAYVNGTWQHVATLDYHYAGNQLELRVPRSAIGQSGAVSLQFKWADNVQRLYDISEFFVNGDAAPDRRFNYQYGISSGLEGMPLPRGGWTVTASASSGSDPAAHMIDGNVATRWTSGTNQQPGQWVQVDFGSEQTFHRVTLDPGTSGADFARGYQIFVSNDGVNWGAPLGNGTGNGRITTISFAPETARYLRIVQTGSDGFYWWSIHELNVYGAPKGRGGMHAKRWDFNNNVEGWTAPNDVSGFQWQSGGVVTGNITGLDPFLQSPDHVHTDINRHKYVKIRLKNNSSSSTAQLYYTTVANTGMDETKRVNFAITPHSGFVEYVINMTTDLNWTGVLKQLRIDPAAGVSSGSFEIDWISIQNRP